jgi:16S rRNA (uracil1498-N3)-methyltransferase
MHARFYVPDLLADRTAALPAEEAEHLVRVLRLRAGDEVAVFDGRGNEYLARIDSLSRRGVTVRPTVRRRPAPEPSVRLTVALAVTRGDRMDAAVRDAAMLGASVVQPVVTARTETTLASLTRSRRAERWRRVAIASVKQCGRAVVPEVRDALELADYLAAETADLRLLLVEPRAQGASTLAGVSTPQSAAVLIGPEGGWMAQEIAAACRAGFHAITLGQRTLRADATPIAAIAVLQFIWGDL